MSGAITAALAVAGWLLRCTPCLAALAALALLIGGGVYGVTVERARSEARIEQMKRAAGEAAEKRDGKISEELKTKYEPQIARLRTEKAALEQKVRDYAKRKPEKASAKPAVCKLGDAAGLLRPSKPR